MSPVSKPPVPNTWVRRLSQAADHYYTSDGNSSSYSSAEEIQKRNQRNQHQYQYQNQHRYQNQNQQQYQNRHQLQPRRKFSSLVMNDDLTGRSYVDPWDMENYSFLRKQLEDINLTGKKPLPAFEATRQNDFYYVPLDSDGSPQYRYKRYLDVDKDGVSPQSLRNEAGGLLPNVDEYDFYNENLDSIYQIDDPHKGFNNPSRQSERSRYNNQDYQTYIPPSLIKEGPDTYRPLHVCKLQRAASVSFRPDYCSHDFVESDGLPTRQNEPIGSSNSSGFLKSGERKSLTDIKIKLNRRKSFHDFSNDSDFKLEKRERRKSAMVDGQSEKWLPAAMKILPENRSSEKLEKRNSFAEIGGEDFRRKSQRNLEKGILLGPESKCGNRAGLNVSFKNEAVHSMTSMTTASRLQSTPTYIYENGGSKRKTYFPGNSFTKNLERDALRYSHREIHDSFDFDPIERYLNRPTSRYTMTNYGHLKIDYSFSWNYLDKCIAQRVCL